VRAVPGGERLGTELSDDLIELLEGWVCEAEEDLLRNLGHGRGGDDLKTALIAIEEQLDAGDDERMQDVLGRELPAEEACAPNELHLLTVALQAEVKIIEPLIEGLDPAAGPLGGGPPAPVAKPAAEGGSALGVGVERFR
jgi:hypothetical protein